MMVALAWSRVKKTTVRKCLKSAGVLHKDYDVVVLPSHDIDPFLEIEVRIEQEGLMERTVPGERCSIEK